ncbi:MAG: nucleotidyltransferase substrate binding protein [Candidatus Magasanikbacteria bacterium]|nr:nucleotidyltransferase substrate binding protein [Candidatus Magasanikbacteria bacterium]
MDQTLIYKLGAFKKALMTPKEALDAYNPENVETFVRDAAIQRFEYSFELCWKACKVFLFERFGTNAPSPKECFRALRVHELVSDVETETLLQMVDDHNTTTHTYDEAFARQLLESIEKYYVLMQMVLDHMSAG